MALPLLEQGHEVHCLSNRLSGFWEAYTTFSLWSEIGQLEAMVKLLAPVVDVFHCHNEPSWFVTLIKESVDTPVVLDVHDSFLSRTTVDEESLLREKGEESHRVTTEERNNLQAADALVYPGHAFKSVVADEFDLTQPSLVLPSYVPKFLHRYNTGPWHGGVCYEGKVNLPDDTAHGFHYCEYKPLAKSLHNFGIDFHLYAGRNDKQFFDTYNDIAFVHGPLDYKGLIKSISSHDWGLVGNLHKAPQWSIAFPNKMFEYIAAGVPVVSMNADACADFVKSEGVGIAVDDAEDLAWRWPEHRQCRNNIIKRRMDWCMDDHIYELINLYQEVSCG